MLASIFGRVLRPAVVMITLKESCEGIAVGGDEDIEFGTDDTGEIKTYVLARPDLVEGRSLESHTIVSTESAAIRDENRARSVRNILSPS